jgi:hypothetical protein
MHSARVIRLDSTACLVVIYLIVLHKRVHHQQFSLLRMRLFHRTVGVLSLLLTAASVSSAQDTTKAWSFGADQESGVYVGFGRSAGFRLETEFGFNRRKDQASYSFDVGFGTTSVVENISTATYRFGIGLLWQWPAGAHLRLYGGPRVGTILLRSKDVATGGTTGRTTASRSDWFLAGSLGAEYFPVDRLSAGADVQLRGVMQGSVDRGNTGSGTGGLFLPADPTLATRGLLVLRFYL